VLGIDLVCPAHETQVEIDRAAGLLCDRGEQRAEVLLHRCERVSGCPAACADEPALDRVAVVEVAAVHLAEEVRLGADPLVLGRGQLLGARTDSLGCPGRDEDRVGRAGGRLQLVRDHAWAADRDFEGGAAGVRDRERRAAELADDAEVGRESELLEQVREVLAAAARRFVQPDRDDHELAGERAPLGENPRRFGRAGEGALHVGGAAPVECLALETWPLVRDRHRVQVAVEDDGRAGLAAAKPADHDRRRREALVEQLDVQSILLEPLSVHARDLRGVASRALDLDQLQSQVAQALRVDVHVAPLATRKPMCA
jgi:hypothetical protein